MFARQRGAATGQPPSRTRHMRRLMAAEAARRSTRVKRRASAGQTLIIFALTFTVLIGFMGLAIDSIRVYDLYARMQRAAEAGALAGVIYMPNNYSVDLPSSPSDNAVCRAELLVNQNNFGPPHCQNSSNMPANPCPTPRSSIEVAVCPVPNEPYQLQVYVTEPIDVLFLSALNVGPVTITATAIAAYLPPVSIASDPTGTGSTGSWGTFGECNGASSACTGTGSVRNWSGNINGPGELKEQGDPLVTCAEGPGTPSSLDADASVKPELYTTYTGLPTNHPQSGYTPATVGSCGNTDTQGAFAGPSYYDPASGAGPTHVGYGFFVDIPAGAAAQNLWIWNAPFSPSQPKSCNGRSGGQNTTSYDIFYEFNCGGNSGTAYPTYPGTTCATGTDYSCQDPNLYFSVTYSIYKLTGSTDITGTLQATYTAWPYAGQGSCGKGQHQTLPAISAPYNETATTGLSTTSGVCISSPCVANWCPLGNHLGDNATAATFWPAFQLTPNGASDGFYRVMVVASDYGTPSNYHLGWGGHTYSMKLCPAAATTQASVQTCTPGGSIGGWNMSDAVFLFPGNGAGGKPQTTEYPLGVIDKSFAGRTLDVQLYDPGDLSGNNGAPSGSTFYAVAPPTSAADPCTATTAQLSAAGYSTANFTFPSPERGYTQDPTIMLNNLPALEPALNGDLKYNGLWVDEQITVPSNYQYSNATWTLCAQAPQTTDADVLGIGVFSLGQSPVHLVQ